MKRHFFRWIESWIKSGERIFFLKLCTYFLDKNIDYFAIFTFEEDERCFEIQKARAKILNKKQCMWFL